MSPRVKLAFAAGLIVAAAAGWLAGVVSASTRNVPTVTVYDDWRLTCPVAQAKASCVPSQEVIDGKSRARVANLRLVQQGKNESLVVTAPYNVLLRAGLGIAFGNAKARRYPYITCTTEGCIAQIPVDDALRASLREGPRGVLLVTGMNGQITQISFSLRGFERADKARRRFESSFWWLPA